MANGTDEAIKRILENDEVPPRVSNPLLMGVMLEIRRDFNEYRKERMQHDEERQRLETVDKNELLRRMAEIEQQVSSLAATQSTMIKEMREHPSLMWLLRYEPRKTIGTIIFIFFFLMTAFTLSHPVLDLLQSLIP